MWGKGGWGRIKKTASWDEVFALWPKINLDWDLLRCVPGFFRPDAGDPVTEDRLRRSGIRQEREEREKEDQVRHPLNRATAKQKKVYSGRKKKFYFVFFVFFERHFRFFVRLYFCHRMLKWRGKSSSQENDDISLEYRFFIWFRLSLRKSGTSPFFREIKTDRLEVASKLTFWRETWKKSLERSDFVFKAF